MCCEKSRRSLIKMWKIIYVAFNAAHGYFLGRLNGSFLHALSWQSVWKNCPSVIWKFSCVSRLKNGSQGSFWGRGRRPRPRNDPRLPFFNRDTQENFQITQGHFCQTLRQVQWVKERAFSNFLVFSYDHSDHWLASFHF